MLGLKILRNKYIVLLLLWLLVILLYYPARHFVLMDDAALGFHYIQEQSFWEGMKHPFEMNCNFQSLFLAVYLQFHLFGLHEFPYFLWTTFSHALITFLIYQFFRRGLFKEYPSELSILTTLFFLFSPYAGENAGWAATGHYALVSVILFMTLIKLTTYLNGTGKYPWLFNLIYIPALFSIEVALLFPFIYFLYWLYHVYNKSTSVSLWKFFSKVLLFPIILTGLYFFLLKWNTGSFLPRYAVENHWKEGLVNIPVTLERFLIKIFAFGHFLPYSWRTVLYQLPEDYTLFFSLGLLFILIGILFFLKNRKNRGRFLFMLASAVLLLSMFLPLYFNRMFPYENDRFTYISLSFFLPAWGFVLYTLNKNIFRFVGGMWIFISIFFMLRSVQDRKTGAELYHTVLQQIPLPGDSTEHHYYLNIPTYCNGVFAFRYNTSLPGLLEIHKKFKLPGNIHQVSLYNALSPVDSFYIKEKTDSSLYVVQKTPGSWWWWDERGATDYETDRYRVHFDQWCGYELKFKSKPGPKDKVYFFNYGRFIEVK